MADDFLAYCAEGVGVANMDVCQRQVQSVRLQQEM